MKEIDAPPLYGLARGRQWIAKGRSSRIPSGPLVDRCTGEPLWLPRLGLGTADQAWVTTKPEVAAERRQMLMIVNGLATEVRRLG